VAGARSGVGVAADGRLDGLVPRTADVEVALALLQQREHLFVEPPREHHRAEALAEALRLEVGGRKPIDVD